MPEHSPLGVKLQLQDPESCNVLNNENVLSRAISTVRLSFIPNIGSEEAFLKKLAK